MAGADHDALERLAYGLSCRSVPTYGYRYETGARAIIPSGWRRGVLRGFRPLRADVNTLIAALGNAIIARADWLGFRPVLVGGIHDPEFIKHP